MRSPLRRGRPSADDLRQRVEEQSRAAGALGARVHFLPTVGHAGWVRPLLAQLLVTVAAIALARAWPLVSALFLLALAASALRDLAGGRGWFRRLLPREPGWVASIALPQPGAEEGLTLLLWVPGSRRTRLAWLQPLLRQLFAHPLRRVQLRVALGTLGSTWNDDLEVHLYNRWEPLDRRRCLVLALQPDAGPLLLVEPDGPLHRRRPAPRLVEALQETGLAIGPGATGARRARQLGFRAIGLRGGEADPVQTAQALEAALRCLDGLSNREGP